MKKNYQISFLAALLLFTTQSLFSQINFSPLIQQSDVVIEGKVIKQETFWGENDKYIYTKSTLKTYKIFKGQSIPTEIDLITIGGELDGQNHSWSHGFVISLNEKGIFFLKEKANRNYNIVNGYKGLITFRKIFQDTPKGYTSGYVFNNIEEDVYQSLQNLTGKREILDLNDYEREILERSITLSSSDDCAEYKIKNLKVTTVNPSNQFSTSSTVSFNLEFDIDIRSLQNIFDLSRTLLKMTYSTNILGSNLASSNNMVASLKSDFGNYELTLYDDAPDKVAVNIEKIQNAIAEEINSYHKGLYHAVIGIQNYDPTLSLSLTVDENLDIKTYKEINNVISEINCNIYDENVDVLINQLMPPEITSYNAELTAGTRTLLTIDGDNFDAERYNSEIWFKNAYNHSLDEWIKPLSGDYHSWSNNQIQVYVPTSAITAISGGPFGTDRNYAGSGEFRVVKYDDDGTPLYDEGNVTVYYAVKNETFNSKSQPVLLRKENTENGYTVSYTNAFKNKTNINNNKFTDAFERALNKWCEVTGLNYTLDADAYENGGDYDVLIDIVDNPISIDNPASTLSTIINSNCPVTLNNSSPNHPETFEADFLESSIITFHDDSFINPLWDAASVGQSSHNVEKISLHELGHAHGILHTNDSDELMYYSPLEYDITSQTANASHYLQEHSEIHSCQSEGNYAINYTCGTNSIHQISDQVKIKTYASNNIIIIENDSYAFIDEIKIYSVDGREIAIRKNTNEGIVEIPILNSVSIGIYFVKVRIGEIELVDKVLISK